MKITLQQMNNQVHFQARDSEGHVLDFDGAADTQLGEGQGMRPMQGILSALAACSAFDLVIMLKKSRQNLIDLKVEVEAEREDAVPAVFKHIHLKFKLYGDLDEKRCRRFIQMSVHQYCSVASMLAKTARITHDYEIISQEEINE